MSTIKVVADPYNRAGPSGTATSVENGAVNTDSIHQRIFVKSALAKSPVSLVPRSLIHF